MIEIKDVKKENVKRIKEAILLNASIELKINVYNHTKPYYFKGCILKYESKNDIIWFWDIFANIKKFQLNKILSIKIIQENAFAEPQLNFWIKQIPKEQDE